MPFFSNYDKKPTNLNNRRLQREYTTFTTMSTMYCKTHHSGKNTLCSDCKELLSYAKKRLECCPFQEKKSTCGKCNIHCYKKSMQKKVKKVMSFAGPRMILSHPVMALRHLIDGWRSPPHLNK